jgi:hypothetical protein
LDDLSDELDGVEDLVHAWAQSRPGAAAVTLPAADLEEQKIDACHVWANGDLVHMVPALYSAIGLSIIASIDELGVEVSEPHQKRPRLESVIVRLKKGQSSKSSLNLRAGHQVCFQIRASM